MDIEKFTDRSKGFLQAAQTIALRESHQRVTSAHLLKALLDDEEGMAANLIAAAGGNAQTAQLAANTAVQSLPKVSGSGAQMQWDQALVRLLDQAEQIASKAGDSFVTVERLLLALVLATDTEAGKALHSAGVTAQALNAAIENLRKGRTADSATAEDRYDALKK
jgi:ATP-dependent Clp protease ATP-binding subunit ClpB